MKKLLPWITFNTLTFTLFIYFTVGVFLCEVSPIHFSGGGLYPCRFYNSVFLSYLTFFWILVNLIGIIVLWYQRVEFLKNLKITIAFLAVATVASVAFPVMGIIQNSIRQERENYLNLKEKGKTFNTVNNFQLDECDDYLNENSKLVMTCLISAKYKGEYIITGQLYKDLDKNYDAKQILLEAKPARVWLGCQKSFELVFEHKLIPEYYTMPDGPYLTRINLTPIGQSAEFVNRYTFSATYFDGEKVNYDQKLITNNYPGSVFNYLEYKQD